LATEQSAELVVAYAWTPPVVFAGETIGLPAGFLTDLIATAQRELAAWKTEAIGLGATKVTTEFLTGAAWQEVVSLAKRDPAIGLIVTGTHSRTGIKHAVLGSIAEKIVRHAPCAVMVVPVA
jgi:nucleotide-binding universal stress UspA family protein